MAASQDDRLLVERIDDYRAFASENVEWFQRQGSCDRGREANVRAVAHMLHEGHARGSMIAFLPPQRLSAELTSIGRQADRRLTPRYFLYGSATPGSHSG